MCGLAACGVIFLGFPDRYNFHHKNNWLVSTELPLWRPCSIQQSELVVQLAHHTQPWDGTQLLHMRFGSHKLCHFVICQYLLSTNYIYIADPWLLPWAKKPSLCTYDLGLPRGFCIMSIWIIYIFSHNQGDQVSGSQKLWPTVLLFWPHEDPQVLYIVGKLWILDSKHCEFIPDQPILARWHNWSSCGQVSFLHLSCSDWYWRYPVILGFNEPNKAAKALGADLRCSFAHIIIIISLIQQRSFQSSRMR